METVFKTVVTIGINARVEENPALILAIGMYCKQQETEIREKGISFGEEGNYFKVVEIPGEEKFWIIVDDYGELGFDGEPNPGVHSFVQTVLYPDEY